MIFKEIRTSDFRNLSNQIIKTDSEDVVLTGKNGQGKTNFLEALYILCYGSSFRTNYLKEAICHEKEGFSLNGSFVNDYGENQTITTSFSSNKRKIMIDGKEINDRRDLIYQFPCIVFCHDDMEFIKGEPENRRKFFDQMMSLYSPWFFDILRSYRNILTKRNAAIKNEQYSLISLYDGRLAQYGIEIMKNRADAVYEFNLIFPEIFSRISESDLKLEIKYQPSWNSMIEEEEIVSYLESNQEHDIKMQTTTSGVHRDRFLINTQYGPLTSIGSTGQLRLCSILFRISEIIYFTKMTGKKPILLIDDVLLELDPKKRGNLLKELENKYSQAFYTFLPDENYFNENKKTLQYQVNGGIFEL